MARKNSSHPKFFRRIAALKRLESAPASNIKPGTLGKNGGAARTYEQYLAEIDTLNRLIRNCN